jgi:hypothetical protein
MSLAALSYFWLFISSPPACVSFRKSCVAPVFYVSVVSNYKHWLCVLT